MTRAKETTEPVPEGKTCLSPGQSSLSPLQQRFMKSGFNEFGDDETVELLLSLIFLPRKSKQLAKLCMERFKNLTSLLTASAKELSVVGLTPHCIFGIKILRELPAEVLKQKIIEKPAHQSSKEIFDYLYCSMRDLKKEVFKVIYLNSRSQIIDTVDLFEGTFNSTPVRPREIVESAMEHKAAALIFVHNHPSGEPSPGRSDKEFTKQMVFAGNIIQIKVLDHIIIGANRYFSFADEGLIQKYEDNFLDLRVRGRWNKWDELFDKQIKNQYRSLLVDELTVGIFIAKIILVLQF